MRTDRSLARRAAAGDSAAFETIFRRYHQELYRYCRAILRSEDDARDALQSTMVAALRALPGDEREIALKPWLYRVAHNEAISIMRAREPLVDPSDAPEGQVPGADQELDDRARLRCLVADLGELPDRQRSAILMRELSGLSFAEIAAAQESSEAAVRQTLYEARSGLADMEEGRGLNCDDVRHAISDGDGRRLRGRRLRAHLRSCEACSAYERAIATRRADLQALCPPLPAAIGAGILASALASHGGGAAAGAGLGTAAAGAGGAAGAGSAAGGSGLIGGGLAASGAVKAASVLAAVAVGVGTADATGVVHLPLLHRDAGASNVTTGAADAPVPSLPASGSPGHDSGSSGASKSPNHGGSAPHAGDSNGGHGSHSTSGDGHGVAGGHAHSSAANNGAEPNGRAVGHTGEGGAGGSSSNASANGLAHSSRGSSHSASHASGSSSAGGSPNSHGANAGGSSNSHGANAGGSSNSEQSPGHTKPAGPPPSAPSNGGSGGTHGSGPSNAGGQGNGNGAEGGSGATHGSGHGSS